MKVQGHASGAPEILFPCPKTTFRNFQNVSRNHRNSSRNDQNNDAQCFCNLPQRFFRNFEASF
jgi:hypothetical protein